MKPAVTGTIGRLVAPLGMIVSVVLAGALIRSAYAVHNPNDLGYFLVAGRTWANGGDPYGHDFLRSASDLVVPALAVWAYPPQWWAFARAIALFDPASAAVVWKTANLVFLGLSLALLYPLRWHAGKARHDVLFYAVVALVLTADSTRYSLLLGQTGMLSFLGLALFLNGTARAQGWKQVIGLVVLLLKPQIGLPFLVILLADRATRTRGMIALLVSAIACVPALVVISPTGVLALTGRWLRNLSLYGGMKWNSPLDMTGLAHLVALLGWRTPSLGGFALVGCLLACTTIWYDRRITGAASSLRPWLKGLAVLFAVVPLHIYDLIVFPIFVLLVPGLRAWARWLIVLANLLIWRMDTIVTTVLFAALSDVAKPFADVLSHWSFAALATYLAAVAILFGWKPSSVAAPSLAGAPTGDRSREAGDAPPALAN